MTDSHTSARPVLRPLPRTGSRSLASLFAFAAIIVLKIYVVRLTLLGDANPLRAVLLEGGFAFLLVSALALLPRGRLWAWLALDALFSVACVSVLVYAVQFDQVVTVGALRMSRELLGVRGAVVALVKPAYLLFVADVPVLAALLFASARRSHARADASRHDEDASTRPSTRQLRYRIDKRVALLLAVATAWSVAVLISMVTATPIDDGAVAARSHGLLAYALMDAWQQESVESGAEIAEQVARASTANAQSTSASVSPSATRTTSTPSPNDADLETVDVHSATSVQNAFDVLQGGPGGKRVEGASGWGAARGHDVIIIQVESLSTWATLVSVNDQKVTPRFARLAAESWYAPKTITQIGPGTTSDAEFTANTSLLADRSQPTSYIFGGKKIPSLPRLVRDLGYEALTFHTNHVSYWKRHRLYPALGFSKWYSKPDFPKTDIIDGIGASDRVLYEKVAEVLEAKHAEGKHFLAEVITLAAHSPYLGASARSKLSIPVSLRGTTLEDYLRAINYEDSELGAFIDRLKDDGIWDDAVVVVYGDHFGIRPLGGSSIPLSRRESEAIAEMLGREATWADTYEVPFLVHMPGQTEGHVIDTIRAQADIMPTVADVLGLDLAATPHTGISVFDTRPRNVVMRYYVPNGTFVTDEFLFKPVGGYKNATVSKLNESGKGNLPLSTVPVALYDRMKTLAAVNKLYLQSLPDR